MPRMNPDDRKSTCSRTLAASIGSRFRPGAACARCGLALLPNGTFDAPRRLTDRSNFLINDRFHSFSVAPDGKRILMIHLDEGAAPRQLNVILNWLEAPRGRQ